MAAQPVPVHVPGRLDPELYPSVLDPRVEFLWDPTPQARYDRLEECWKNLRGSARKPWRGWEHFLGLHSFYHFSVMHNWPDADSQRLLALPHWEMALFYEDVLTVIPYAQRLDLPDDMQRRKKRMVFAPRETFKSTFLVLLSEWLLCIFPHLRIIYGRALRSDAQDTILQMASHFSHNPYLQEYWPEYAVEGEDPETGKQKKRPTPWGKAGLMLPVAMGASRKGPQPNIKPSGVDRAETGQHYDIFMPDDYVTEKNCRSEIGRATVIRAFTEMYNVMGRRGVWVGCGTPWTKNDAYAWLQGTIEGDERETDIFVFKRGATTEPHADGDPLYPVLLPTDYLKKLRGRIGPALYSCLYDCTPSGGGDATFNMACTRYFKLDELLQRGRKLQFHIFVDPAGTTTATADKTAVVIVGIDAASPPHVYVMGCHCQRFTKTQVIHILREEYCYWKGHPLNGGLRVWMQKVQLDAVYKDLVETYIRPDVPDFVIMPLERHTHVQKWVEIGAMEPLHSHGDLLLRVRDDVNVMDMDRDDVDGMLRFLTPDMQFLFRQMRDHVRNVKDQDDDAIDALAQVRKVMNSGAASVPDPVKEEPRSVRDIEMKRRIDRQRAREDFERRMDQGEYEDMDMTAAIAEYKENYLDEVFAVDRKVLV